MPRAPVPGEPEFSRFADGSRVLEMLRALFGYMRKVQRQTDWYYFKQIERSAFVASEGDCEGNWDSVYNIVNYKIIRSKYLTPELDELPPLSDACIRQIKSGEKRTTMAFVNALKEFCERRGLDVNYIDLPLSSGKAKALVNVIEHEDTKSESITQFSVPSPSVSSIRIGTSPRIVKRTSNKNENKNQSVQKGLKKKTERETETSVGSSNVHIPRLKLNSGIQQSEKRVVISLPRENKAHTDKQYSTFRQDNKVRRRELQSQKDEYSSPQKRDRLSDKHREYSQKQKQTPRPSSNSVISSLMQSLCRLLENNKDLLGEFFSNQRISSKRHRHHYHHHTGDEIEDLPEKHNKKEIGVSALYNIWASIYTNVLNNFGTCQRPQLTARKLDVKQLTKYERMRKPTKEYYIKQSGMAINDTETTTTTTTKNIAYSNSNDKMAKKKEFYDLLDIYNEYNNKDGKRIMVYYKRKFAQFTGMNSDMLNRIFNDPKLSLLFYLKVFRNESKVNIASEKLPIYFKRITPAQFKLYRSTIIKVFKDLKNEDKVDKSYVSTFVRSPIYVQYQTFYHLLLLTILSGNDPELNGQGSNTTFNSGVFKICCEEKDDNNTMMGCKSFKNYFKLLMKLQNFMMKMSPNSMEVVQAWLFNIKRSNKIIYQWMVNPMGFLDLVMFAELKKQKYREKKSSLNIQDNSSNKTGSEVSNFILNSLNKSIIDNFGLRKILLILFSFIFESINPNLEKAQGKHLYSDDISSLTKMTYDKIIKIMRNYMENIYGTNEKATIDLRLVEFVYDEFIKTLIRGMKGTSQKMKNKNKREDDKIVGNKDFKRSIETVEKYIINKIFDIFSYNLSTDSDYMQVWGNFVLKVASVLLDCLRKEINISSNVETINNGLIFLYNASNIYNNLKYTGPKGLNLNQILFAVFKIMNNLLETKILELEKKNNIAQINTKDNIDLDNRISKKLLRSLYIILSNIKIVVSTLCVKNEIRIFPLYFLSKYEPYTVVTPGDYYVIKTLCVNLMEFSVIQKYAYTNQTKQLTAANNFSELSASPMRKEVNTETQSLSCYKFPKHKLLDIIKYQAQNLIKSLSNILFHIDSYRVYEKNKGILDESAKNFLNTIISQHNSNCDILKSVHVDLTPLCLLMIILIGDISESSHEKHLRSIIKTSIDKLKKNYDKEDTREHISKLLKFLVIFGKIYNFEIENMIEETIREKKFDKGMLFLALNSGKKSKDSNHKLQVKGDEQIINPNENCYKFDFSYLKRIINIKDISEYNMNAEIKPKLLQTGFDRSVDKLFLFMTKIREVPNINKIEKARLDYERQSIAYEDISSTIAMEGRYNSYLYKNAGIGVKYSKDGKLISKKDLSLTANLGTYLNSANKAKEAYIRICNNFNGVF